MEGPGEDFMRDVALILSKALSNNNEERNHYEALYHRSFQADPEEVLISLASVMANPNVQIRTLSAVLLKKHLSPSSDTWEKVSETGQHYIKSALLTFLSTESDRKIKELLSEDIGLLGVTILTSKGAKGVWPELLPHVYLLIGTGGPLRSAGLHILQAMFPYMFDEMMENSTELMQIFRCSLEDEDYTTRLACLTAITSLLTVADSKKCLLFTELVPDMLRSVDFILEKNTYSGTKAMDTLTELAQSEPKLFKSSFVSCIELVQHICKKPAIDIGIRNTALEFAVSIAERIPAQIQKKIELGTTLLALIFEMMLGIESEVDESWKVPEEGFCEKDEEDAGGVDIDYAKIGRKLVSRLVESVGDKFLLQPCLASIQQALSPQADWRVSYAALMTLSEVLQFIEDDSKLVEALPIITSHMESSNCKIRYAAFHVLGQLCEDHGPEFQRKHHEVIYPKLIAGLRDPVPRVLAHACAAITNFVENIGAGLANHYAALFVPVLADFLQQPNPSLVIENTCTCLAAIASSTTEGFKDYFLPLLQQLLLVFDKYNQDKYKALQGRLIECVTLISKSVGKMVFMPYADKIVALMRYTQEAGNSQDELTGYVLNGWQRLCELLGEDFVLFAGNIIPGILKSLSGSVEMSTSSAPSHFVDMTLALEDKKSKNLSTTETENKELGLQTLLTFVEEMKEKYAQYVESTVLVTVPLLDFTMNESVRSAAAMLLAGLVSVVKPLDMTKAVQMSKIFIEGIWKAIDEEYTNETLVDELQAIREIISTIEVPFLSVDEVKIIGQKSLKILDDSLQNRIKVQEDSDDENDEGFQEYTKKEEDSLHVTISEVFGTLFRTHKDSCTEIVDFMYTTVFGKLLAPETRDEDHKFVIFIIDDMLEFLGQERIREKWGNLGEVLVRFSCDPHDAVRQAAVYGLGIFAENSASEGFQQWTELSMQKLEQAITFPIGKSVKTHGHARDNAIAAVGKLIKHHHVHMNLKTVVPAWLSLLPLKFDKIEGKVVTSLIADILLEKPAVLLGESFENFNTVLILLVDVLDTKLIKEDTLPKVKEILQRLEVDKATELAALYAQLDQSQRSKVSNLINT